jgi:endo-1,4-beta-xylanase
MYQSNPKFQKLITPIVLMAFLLSSGPQCIKQADAAGPAIENTQVTDKEGLKDYYKDYFPIGVAVNIRSLRGPEADLITKEFNSITAENDMKMALIHPSENIFNWNNSDSIVDFAVRNKIKVRGHTLLWHNQAPAWMFRDNNGQRVSKALLLKRLKHHITTVMSRYKGKIYAWDVVNEAIDDAPENYLRNSVWYQICGEDFIAKAFEYAHKADPAAELYYNDYNSENENKREKIYKLLKNLKEAKVPITGVGLQGHWKLDVPSADLIRMAIDRYASLGLKIQITELDITIRSAIKNNLSSSGENINQQELTGPGLTPELAKKQAGRYQSIFEIFREYQKVITGVTFWNISDRYSWLDSRNGGIAGGAAAGEATTRKIRKAYPLLFDENLQRKPAYWAVTAFSEK